MQYMADGVGVLEGAELGFGQPSEFPCEDCGGMVDLTSEITVSITNSEGSVSRQEKMSEADARALLAQLDIPPPPVLCSRHEVEGDIITERTV